MGEVRTLTAAQAAAILGVGRTTARRLFDTSAGRAGTRDTATGERRFDPGWVAERAARSPRSVHTGISVADAARRLGVARTTVRAWFDRDRPNSGTFVEGGRTGGGERRCSPAWVESLLREREDPSDPPQ